MLYWAWADRCLVGHFIFPSGIKKENILHTWRWPCRPKHVVWPSTTNRKTIYNKAARRRQLNLKSYLTYVPRCVHYCAKVFDWQNIWQIRTLAHRVVQMEMGGEGSVYREATFYCGNTVCVRAQSGLCSPPHTRDGLETEITFRGGGAGGRRASVAFLNRAWQEDKGCNPPSFTLQPPNNVNQYIYDFFFSLCNFISRQ
jgi:hypothetical protein